MMKINLRLALLLLPLVPLVDVAAPGEAAACVNATSADELTIAGRVGCNWDFVLWADSAYGSAGGENWDDPNNGRQDACNPFKPFAKWMDTAALLTHDFTTGSSNGNTRSFFSDGGLLWHGLNDYSECPKAPANGFHDGVYYNVQADVSTPGSTTWASAKATSTWSLFSGTTTYEWTDLYCQVFDNSTDSKGIVSGSEPGWRAAVALHEAWHHWQIKNGYDSSHPAGCPGGVGTSCDYYFFHKLKDFDFGQLPTYSTGTPLLFHSPQQVAMEYLCDLAEESTDWVVGTPIALVSKLEANYLAATVFVNPVGWTCGTNRIPLYP